MRELLRYSRDDKDIDADKATGESGNAGVEEQHRKDGEGTQAIDAARYFIVIVPASRRDRSALVR